MSNGHRRPKTRQEAAASLDAEYVYLVRAKRTGCNLPHAWDDIPYSRRGRPDKYKNHRRNA